MALKLMYITNRTDMAVIAENAGVDRIFVDMEYIGKKDRQGGLDTVQSHHSVADVRALRAVVKRAELMVRLNPIHEATEAYGSSRKEIEATIAAGADLLMLPYFRTVEEARFFCETVAGRAKTMLLVETPEAVEALDEILEIPGLDEIHVGLNDLSLAVGHKFMFVPLADGTVDTIGAKCRAKGIPFGIGGIASLGNGILPSEYVIREHYRLGSNGAILSRSFCDVHKIQDPDVVRDIFEKGMKAIRNLEQECSRQPADSAYFRENRQIVIDRVNAICEKRTGRV